MYIKKNTYYNSIINLYFLIYQSEPMNFFLLKPVTEDSQTGIMKLTDLRKCNTPLANRVIQIICVNKG